MKTFHAISIALLLLPKVVLSQETIDWGMEAQRLADSRQLWAAGDIDSYSFVMEMSCRVCRLYFPATVKVEDGNIVAVLDPSTGEPMRKKIIDGQSEPSLPEQVDWYETIERMFVVIEEAIRDHEGTLHPGAKVQRLVVEYDPIYGYPTRISADYGRSIDAAGNIRVTKDRDVGYKVRDFSAAN